MNAIQPNQAEIRFIACGMYVFDDASEWAWRTLCQDLLGTRNTVVFDSDDDTYQSSAMLLGHTCGYPLLQKWQGSHLPVCAPVFDIAGCDGFNYRSWFICNRARPGGSLRDFRGGRAAINSGDSNSGMNVLRYAISALIDPPAGSQQYFERVIETGSHAESVESVASGAADIAAVDAVSYHHLKRTRPALCDKISIFGRSVSLPGLPFIAHRAGADEASFDCHARSIIDALNRRLGEINPDHTQVLRIRRFERVQLSDYAAIQKIERVARRRGYPEIR